MLKAKSCCETYMYIVARIFQMYAECKEIARSAVIGYVIVGERFV